MTVNAEPAWWRGQSPPTSLPEEWRASRRRWIVGSHSGSLDESNPSNSGLRDMSFFRADVRNAEVRLDDVHLTATWSKFEGYTFRQRARPVLNEHGIAAQGAFGNRPSIYRHCTFERIRFKTLGGFSMLSARFEDCVFINCRWEGHFAHDADLVNSRFIGKMNGCVWFGHGTQPDGTPRTNILRGNDFTQSRITANVAWRSGFPSEGQVWPEGFVPLMDPA